MVSRIEMTEVFKYIIHIWEMFSVLSRAWDKEKILSPRSRFLMGTEFFRLVPRS